MFKKQWLKICNYLWNISQIFEEEALLAVALLPLLSELVIHSNPLTTQRSGKGFMCATLFFVCLIFCVFFKFQMFVCLLGDPPMLTWFLQNRLGIKIRRKKSDDNVKPHLVLPVNPKRKVIYPFMRLIFFIFIMPLLNSKIWMVKRYLLVVCNSKFNSNSIQKSAVHGALLFTLLITQILLVWSASHYSSDCKKMSFSPYNGPC